jgi:molybdopterin/thiamine biosynthesis adenylyltransferase
MPMEDFGLSPEEQLMLHDLTEQAVSQPRQGPFGPAPEPEVNAPTSPWETVAAAPELSDSVLEGASSGFDTTVFEEDSEPPQEENNETEDVVSAEESVNQESEQIADDLTQIAMNEDTDALSPGSLHITPVTTPREVTVETTEDMLTPNTEGVYVESNTARFSSAIWYENLRNKVIILAGVGGIGSWTAVLLGKLQPRSIFMYDNDDVEAVNMAGQLYSTQDLGKPKVDALADTIKKYAAYDRTFAVYQYYDADCEPADIMICGFDNMRARLLFFKKWKAHVDAKPEDQRGHCLFIDGRLAAEELQVFCITGDNRFSIANYEAHYLFSDSQAEATVCSYKQTAFVANMIAGIMVNLLVNFAANECNPPMPRSLPFKTIYNAEMMFFSTEEV